jgi:hypothetical protein
MFYKKQRTRKCNTMPQGIMFAEHTALPTTVKTLIGAEITLPKGVKQIVGISADCVHDTITAGAAVQAMVSLESTDIAFYNAQFMVNPIHAVLSSGAPGYSDPKFWPLYVPVTGGEKLSIYGTVKQDGTTDPFMGASLIISDQAPVFPQKKGKVGTTTSLTSATLTVTDAAFSVNGGAVLDTVYGVITHAGVIAATDPIYGFGNIKSSDLLPPFPLKFGIAGAHGLLSTAAAVQGGPIQEHDVDLQMAASVTMELSMKAESTATNEYKGTIGITYI